MNAKIWRAIFYFLSYQELIKLQGVSHPIERSVKEFILIKPRLRRIDTLIHESTEFQSYLAFERQFSKGTQWERKRVENALLKKPYLLGEKVFRIIYFSLSTYITALCVHSYNEMTLRRALFPIVFTSQYYFYTEISAIMAISRLLFFNRELSLATDCIVYLTHLFNLTHAASLGNIYPASLIWPEAPLALAILIDRPLRHSNLPYKKLLDEKNLLLSRCQSLYKGIHQYALKLEEETDEALIFRATSTSQPCDLRYTPLPLEIYEQFLKKSSYKATSFICSSEFLSIKDISILRTASKFFNRAIQTHINHHAELNQFFERIKQSQDYQNCVTQHNNYHERLSNLQLSIRATAHIPGEKVLLLAHPMLSIYLALLSLLNYVNILADYQNNTVDRDAALMYSVWAFVCLASAFMPFIKECSFNERGVCIAIHFLGLLAGAACFNTVSFTAVIPAETLFTSVLLIEKPIKQFNRPYNALVDEKNMY